MEGKESQTENFWGVPFRMLRRICCKLQTTDSTILCALHLTTCCRTQHYQHQSSPPSMIHQNQTQIPGRWQNDIVTSFTYQIFGTNSQSPFRIICTHHDELCVCVSMRCSVEEEGSKLNSPKTNYLGSIAYILYNVSFHQQERTLGFTVE